VFVSPDIFGGVRVPCEVAAVELQRHSFQSDSDLREAVKNGRLMALRGEIEGRS
jgi:hypothetical protein